jgi:hypothetical protein
MVIAIGFATFLYFYIFILCYYEVDPSVETLIQ